MSIAARARTARRAARDPNLLGLTVGAPTGGGTLPVAVGRKVFGVMPGSYVSQQTLSNGQKIAYVWSFGDLRVLIETGEILDIPFALGVALADKIFGVGPSTVRTVAGRSRP